MLVTFIAIDLDRPTRELLQMNQSSMLGLELQCEKQVWN